MSFNELKFMLGISKKIFSKLLIVFEMSVLNRSLSSVTSEISKLNIY